jgi:2-amino-4-hydroxy-6-hydroxymethyldihydropteridine diphosphokinase
VRILPQITVHQTLSFLNLPMNIAYLLLGSNLGDKGVNLTTALKLIEKSAGKIVSKSLVYETAPWGIEDQEDFLNQAICLETQLSARELLKNILLIEERLGRIRTKKWEARLIDIDILFFNSDVIRTKNLTIPHPFLHQRKFVLVPLCQIEEAYIHPVLKKTVKELLSDCDQHLPVTPVLNTAF